MLEVETVEDAKALTGQLLGISQWLLIDQQMVDEFANLTRDRNWIHVDVERAKRELPGGKTIVHGMLTLSLVIHLGADIFSIRRRKHGINYGADRVRFTAPVPVGSRVRLQRTLQAYEPVAGGARLTFSNRIEVEGAERPAMVAETISIVYAA
jgi:acyl dehydratase